MVARRGSTWHLEVPSRGCAPGPARRSAPLTLGGKGAGPGASSRSRGPSSTRRSDRHGQSYCAGQRRWESASPGSRRLRRESLPQRPARPSSLGTSRSEPAAACWRRHARSRRSPHRASPWSGSTGRAPGPWSSAFDALRRIVEPVAAGGDPRAAGPDVEGVAGTGWKLGTPVWTGGCDAIQYRIDGRIDRLRAHFVRSEIRPLRQPASTARPSIRTAGRLGRRRVDRTRQAELRSPPRRRVRSPHGGIEPCLLRGVGRDPARDPGLPREVERMEGHRLQLPGRPLRPGVRRARRRHAAKRHRCPRARLQHGQRRGLAARQLPEAGPDAGGVGGPRRAARLADGHRPCRPAVAGRLLLRRQGAHAAGRLRPPRRQLDRVPGREALHAARCDRGRCLVARPAEALRAQRGCRRWGRLRLPRPALGNAGLDGHRHGRRRRPGRLRRR